MAATAGHNVTGRGKTVPEILALAFGAIYLLVGIVGFFVTGFDELLRHTRARRCWSSRSTACTTSSTS